MTKIIFRPNSATSPVTPPTPSLDTQIHATFDPLNFNPDTPPAVTFSPANLPSYVGWNIEDEYGNAVIVPSDLSPIVPGETYYTNSEASYTPGIELWLALLNEEEEVIYRCEIIIDNA